MRIFIRDKEHLDELWGRNDLFPALCNNKWGVSFFTISEEVDAYWEEEIAKNNEATKAKQEKKYNWFVAKFFMAIATMFLVGACTYNVATSEPKYVPSNPVPPACVETSAIGCNWAGQEYKKSSAD